MVEMLRCSIYIAVMEIRSGAPAKQEKIDDQDPRLRKSDAGHDGFLPG